MKRPLGLWILLSAGFLWLNTQEVYSARRFVKTTTTSTTTISPIESEESIEDEQDTTEADVPTTSNVTKPVLTGNPQIDYVHDPNLPKELNGYNLSDYPFYERVPANITFKCDGLHDGFYAGVIYKCQVYHHCLFGIRYDFLCANFTAFDQTLFNCNFVNKVDCINSKNFWSRNDELYKTKSTPPPPPPLVYNFYTTQSPPIYAQGVSSRRNPLLRRIPPPNAYHIPAEVNPDQPAQSANGLPPEVTAAQIPQVPVEAIPQIPMETIPLLPRRRPLRPRLYYEYYDDEYDEPHRYRRKRPRPRPLYYDDDYEYDDDQYDRSERRRGRPNRRYKGRRDMYEDDEDDVYDESDRRTTEEPRRKMGNRGGVKYESRNKPRREPPRRKNPSKPNRKVPEYDYDDYEDKPVQKNKNPSRRPNSDYEDDEVDTKENSRRRNFEESTDETKTVNKPVGGIFDRPRAAPKINLPMPKNAAEKFLNRGKIKDGEESTETHNSVTTMRGTFKRPQMSRRSNFTSNKKGKPAQPEEESYDEIQESQTSVKVKNPIPEEVTSKEAKLQSSQEKRGHMTRANLFKTRHSLSTPTAGDLDLIEIDDSINEA